MGYTYPEKLPENRVGAEEDLKVKVERSIPENLKDSINWKKYIDRNAEYSVYTHTSGYVYPAWEEIETYLNDILKKLVSDSIVEKYGLHIYPTSAPEVNAFALPSGSIYMNIGMFSVAKNEAMLAAIIGHEVAHHLNHDMAMGYYNKKKKEGGNNGLMDILFRGGFGSEYEFSKGQEELADLQGWEMMVNAGYNIEGAKEIYRLFHEMEEKNRKLLKFSRVLAIGRTHPKSDNRAKDLKAFTEKNGVKGELYLVSEEQFVLLREKARVEMLRQFLKDFEFTDCMERALEFHIFEPENPIYIYYILEGIRRYVYAGLMSSKIEKEEFIMKQHYDEKEIDSYLVYFHLTKSVLNGKNLEHIMYADSAALESVKDHPFFDDEEEEFKSFLEAKDYFAKLAEETNCTECYLSLGVYDYMRNYGWYPAKKNKKDKEPIEWLNKYLAQPDALEKEYAQAMNEHKLITEKMNKELIILNNVTHVKDDEKGNAVDAYEEAEKAKPKYLEYLTNAASSASGKREVKVRKDIRNLHDVMVLDDINGMNYVASSSDYFTNKVLKPQVFDADYWRFLKKHNIANIEFVDIKHKDRFSDWFEVRIRGVETRNDTRNCYKISKGTSSIDNEAELKGIFMKAVEYANKERAKDS